MLMFAYAEQLMFATQGSAQRKSGSSFREEFLDASPIRVLQLKFSINVCEYWPSGVGNFNVFKIWHGEQR